MLDEILKLCTRSCRSSPRNCGALRRAGRARSLLALTPWPLHDGWTIQRRGRDRLGDRPHHRDPLGAGRNEYRARTLLPLVLAGAAAETRERARRWSEFVKRPPASPTSRSPTRRRQGRCSLSCAARSRPSAQGRHRPRRRARPAGQGIGESRSRHRAASSKSSATRISQARARGRGRGRTREARGSAGAQGEARRRAEAARRRGVTLIPRQRRAASTADGTKTA